MNCSADRISTFNSGLPRRALSLAIACIQVRLPNPPRHTETADWNETGPTFGNAARAAWAGSFGLAGPNKLFESQALVRGRALLINASIIRTCPAGVFRLRYERTCFRPLGDVLAGGHADSIAIHDRPA